jgi:hypothetical protein
MARKRSILYLTNKGLQLDLSAHALSKFFARYEIFKMVLNLPGDIVDCGVYRGASLFSWGNLIEIFAPHSQKVLSALTLSRDSHLTYILWRTEIIP